MKNFKNLFIRKAIGLFLFVLMTAALLSAGLISAADTGSDSEQETTELQQEIYESEETETGTVSAEALSSEESNSSETESESAYELENEICDITVSYSDDSDDSESNDELFAGYVEQVLYDGIGEDTYSTDSYWAGVYFDDDSLNLSIYNTLKEYISEVAAEGGSTQFTVELETPIEFSYSSENDDYDSQRLSAYYEYVDASMIVSCLLYDNPYEMYWFDKTVGCSIGTTSRFITSEEDSSGATIYYYNIVAITFMFSVAETYQGTDSDGEASTYIVDADTATAAAKTVTAAKEVVESASGLSDYNKLIYYRDWICEAVSYNDDAADNDDTSYGDPWQIIYVFDGDEDTNVVCEGYSKAFQYLCDLTSFSNSSIICYTVSGYMNSSSTGHMWNIIRINGKSYLVDVTNSDSGTSGQAGGLFLRGCVSGSVSDGFTIYVPSYTIDNLTYSGGDKLYTYKDTILNLYSEDILTLADSDYTDGAVATVTIDETTTEYASLSEAFAAAEDNTAEITLLEDTYISSPIFLSSGNITLTSAADSDGGTYSILNDGKLMYMFYVSGESSLTIESVTVENSYTTSTLKTICVTDGAAVTIKDSIISGGGRSVYVSDGTLTVESSTLTAQYYGIYLSGGTVAISGDTTVTSTSKIALYIASGSVSLSGGTYTGGTASIKTASGTLGDLLASEYAYQLSDSTWMTDLDAAELTSTITVVSCTHSYISEVTDPTCTEGGYTTYTCENCGACYTADETDALGHTEGEAVIENEVEATCTEEGSYDSVVYCTVCGEEISRETVTVEAIGHTAGEAVTENEVEATCTEEGSYDSVVYCTVCGEEISRETITVAATGHSFTDYVSNGDAACTEDGTKTASCDNGCGETDTITDEGSAAGHTEGEAVIENEVEATCMEDGSYDSVVYCTVCGEEISRETVTVDATGHSYDDGVVTTEATCTEDGVKTYTCTVCGDTYTEAVAATGHSYISEYTEATCTEDAYTTYTCTEGDDSYVVTEEGTAAGHTAGEAVTENEVEATCTEDGSYDSVVYCTVCGEEISRETVTVEAIGHTAGEAVTENEVEATCTEDGSYDSVVYCTVCGEELSRETIIVEAAGHSYEAAVTEATCTEGGYTTYTCSVCGDTYTADETDALGHSFTDYISNGDATCTEDGTKTASCDNGCGETDTITDEGSAAGHTEGEAVIENEVEATCTEEGSYDSVVYCTVCGEEISRETITVAATGHSYEASEADEDGVITYTCSVCGDSYTEKIETEAVYYDGLIKIGDVWYYYADGSLASDFTGLVLQTNGLKYYVENGICTLATTAVVESDGAYYYVKNSRLQSNVSGLIKVNETWYYIAEGVVQTNYTGLYLQTNGITYYVEEGICTLATTTVFESDGTYYYVKNSRVLTYSSGLLFADGAWYCVSESVVQTNYTGLYLQTNGITYYVEEGICTLATTCIYEADGTTYIILNSRVAGTV